MGTLLRDCDVISQIEDMEEASLHGSGSSGQIFQTVAEEPPLDLGTAMLSDAERMVKAEDLPALR